MTLQSWKNKIFPVNIKFIKKNIKKDRMPFYIKNYGYSPVLLAGKFIVHETTRAKRRK